MRATIEQELKANRFCIICNCWETYCKCDIPKIAIMSVKVEDAIQTAVKKAEKRIDERIIQLGKYTGLGVASFELKQAKQIIKEVFGEGK